VAAHTEELHHAAPCCVEADPCAWAARRMEEASLGIPERRTEAELVEALVEEEIRLGRAMSRREISGFALGFFTAYSVGTFREQLTRVPVTAIYQGVPIKDDR
jgi:hypothetical protein